MMKFGFSSTKLEPVAKALEAALKVRFDLHESSFRGGDYYLADGAPVKLFLQTNYDLLDKDPFEENWPSGQTILYVPGADTEAGKSFVEALRVAIQKMGLDCRSAAMRD